jgi:DNA-binding PadR family transcriptional regulator
MSGYDLKQFADQSIGHFYWSPAKSQIYTELRRLKEAELVTEEHIEQEARPNKRVYAITDSGRERLTEWVNASPFEQDVFKSTLMLRLFLGSSADPRALVNLLQQNLDFEQGRLPQLQEMEKRCVEAGSDSVFPLMTIRAGIHLTEAAVNWSTESINILETHIQALEAKATDEAMSK